MPGRSSEALRPHLPTRLLERFAPDQPLVVPQERWTDGIALFADVSGFSALSEQLALEAGGPERIKEVLNTCFGTLTDTIGRWGGDVVSFAGDAVLALWADSPCDEASLGAVLECVHLVRRQLDGFEPTRGIPLRLRFGVGFGAIWEPIVGQQSGRCYYLAAGDAVRQATAAQTLARTGEVVLAPSAALPGLGIMSALPNGYARLDRLAHHPAPPKQTDANIGETFQSIGAFVPEIVLEAIESRHVEWLAELRQLSIAFVHLEAFDVAGEEQLTTLQEAISVASEVAERYRGSVPKLLFDDKGLTILMVWGISGHAHEDNAGRAVRAALEIHTRIATTRVGIATGQAFVGALGSDHRREYTMVGNAVNRASRVMENAEDEVLCDGFTYSEAEGEVSFAARGLTRLRGFKEPVALYQPLGARSDDTLSASPMVARDRERRAVIETVLAVASAGGGRRMISLTGEAGIGKSRLVDSVCTTLASSPVRIVAITGSQFDRSSPYHSWRHAYRNLLGLEAASDHGTAIQALSALVDETDAPLIMEALGYDKLEISQRPEPDRTRWALARMFGRLTEAESILLVLDDAQWLDSASLALAESIYLDSDRIVLLTVSRPTGADQAPRDLEAMVEQRAQERIDLGPLEAADALALACQLLNVDFLPSALARLIQQKAEGHPLFTEELVRSLLERRLISVDQAERFVEYDRRLLAEFSPPDTLQGMVASRLDRLTVEEMLTLKVGSILGRQFELAALAGTHPMSPPIGEIESALERIADHELLELAQPGYQFRHAVFADVTYSLMPLTQRHQLHRAAASFFAASDVNGSNLFRLAHHWRLADVPGKAVPTLESAGDRSTELGSFPEAADFYADAYAMGLPSLDSVELARLKRKQGVSLRAMGEFVASHQALLEGLSQLGRPMPSGAQRGLIIARAATTQLLHRLWLRPFKVADGSPIASELLELSELYFALGSTTFQSLDASGLFYVGISALNNAERVAPSGVLALSESFLMYVTGVLGMRRTAARYFDRARSVSERLGHRRVMAEVLYNSAGLKGTLGEWEGAEADNQSALSLYEAAGDQKGVRTVETLLAYHAHLRGHATEEHGRYEHVLELGRQHEDATAIVFSTLQLAEIHLRAGQPALALATTRTLRLPEVESAGGRAAILKLVGMRALASFRLRDATAAAHASDVLDVISTSQAFTAPNAYDGYLLIVRYFIEAGDALQLRTASDQLGRLARGLRIGRPAALWAKGHVAMLSGAQRRSERLWTRGLALAVETRMPFEEMLIRKDLARFLTGSNREEQLRMALDLALPTGAVVEHEQLLRMLRHA